MKRAIALTVGFLMIVAGGSSAFAAKKKGNNGNNGGESQAGGLPALEDRVQQDEQLIAALQASVATLQSQVSTLNSEVGDLQGQNNWVVVASNGAVSRSSSSAGAVAAEHTGTGVYEISFAKDVSGCSYQATIGDPTTSIPSQGQVSVTGDNDGDSNHDVFVLTYDATGTIPTDSPFHLLVSCP